MQQQLHNKYALVTGGSSGMGLEYVRMLAQRGYNVIIVALFQNETDAVAVEMRQAHPDLDFLSIGIDLSTVEAPKKVYDTVAAQRPNAEVEVLINNAGLLHARHFRNISPAQVSSIIMVHNHATALLCSYFMPAMLERRKGYVMNISSLAAWFPFPFLTTIHPCPQDRMPEDRSECVLDLFRRGGYAPGRSHTEVEPYRASSWSDDPPGDSGPQGIEHDVPRP